MIKPYKILFLFSFICTIPIIAMQEEESSSEERINNARPKVSTTNNFNASSTFTFQNPSAKAAEIIANAVGKKYRYTTIFLKETVRGFAVGLGGGIGAGIAENMKEAGDRVLQRVLPTPVEIMTIQAMKGNIIETELTQILSQMLMASQLDDEKIRKKLQNELVEQWKIINEMKRRHLNKMRKLIGKETEQSINSTNTSLEVTEEENSDSEENSSEDIGNVDELLAKLEERVVAEPQG